MTDLPFKMLIETPTEQYRADTFWTKEPETILWINTFKEDGVFFDVGANIGVYSLYAAHLTRSLFVAAFEPLPANIISLLRNVELNQFKRILPMRYAISDKEGICILQIPGNEAGITGAQLIHRPDKRMNYGSSCLVESKRLDNFPGLPRPNYIKIDIDGLELEVVKGMYGILDTTDSILIEVSSKTKEPIVSFLESHGFNTDSPLNFLSNHSRLRRKQDDIDAENIIFTRG